jgi:hypothetical protein
MEINDYKFLCWLAEKAGYKTVNELNGLIEMFPDYEMLTNFLMGI